MIGSLASRVAQLTGSGDRPLLTADARGGPRSARKRLGCQPTGNGNRQIHQLFSAVDLAGQGWSGRSGVAGLELSREELWVEL